MAFLILYLFDIYTERRYNIDMIKSFADKETEKVYNPIIKLTE